MKREWDYPPTMKHHRRPRIEQVEILPPQQPEPTLRVRVVVRHRRLVAPGFWQRLIIFGAIAWLLLNGSPAALLVAAILIGWQFPLAAASVTLALAIVAYRGHRRQF
jgi:hypothetical protein